MTCVDVSSDLKPSKACLRMRIQQTEIEQLRVRSSQNSELNSEQKSEVKHLKQQSDLLSSGLSLVLVQTVSSRPSWGVCCVLLPPNWLLE